MRQVANRQALTDEVPHALFRKAPNADHRDRL
jgi:hypothetical protein